MPLFTLVIEFKARSYTTQVRAASAQQAFAAYLDSIYPVTGGDVFGPEAPELGSTDVIYVTPMDGLVNVWAVCAGRQGQYISAVCSQTEREHAV